MAQNDIDINVRLQGAEAASKRLQTVSQEIDKAAKSGQLGAGRFAAAGAAIAKLGPAANAAAQGFNALKTIMDENASEADKTKAALEGVSGVLGLLGPYGMAASLALQAGIAVWDSYTSAVDRASDAMRTAGDDFNSFGKIIAQGFKDIQASRKEFEGLREAAKRAGVDFEAALSTSRYLLEESAKNAARMAQLRRAIREEDLSGITTNITVNAQAELKELDKQNFEIEKKLKERYKTASQLDAEQRQKEAESRKKSLKQLTEEQRLEAETLKRAGKERYDAMQQMQREYDAGLKLQREEAAAKEAAAIEEHYQDMLTSAMFYNVEKERAERAFTARMAAAASERAQITEQEMAHLAAAAETYQQLRSKMADFGDAAMVGFGQAAAGALFFGRSLSEGVGEVLKSLALEAAGQAVMQGAYALAYLGRGLFLGDPTAFAAAKAAAASAAMFAAFAGATGIVAGVMGSSSAGGAVGVGADGGGSAMMPSERAQRDDRRSEERERNVQIEVNLAAGSASRPMSRADALAISSALTRLQRGRA